MLMVELFRVISCRVWCRVAGFVNLVASFQIVSNPSRHHRRGARGYIIHTPADA